MTLQPVVKLQACTAQVQSTRRRRPPTPSQNSPSSSCSAEACFKVAKPCPRCAKNRRHFRVRSPPHASVPKCMSCFSALFCWYSPSIVTGFGISAPCALLMKMNCLNFRLSLVAEPLQQVQNRMWFGSKVNLSKISLPCACMQRGCRNRDAEWRTARARAIMKQ